MTVMTGAGGFLFLEDHKVASILANREDEVIGAVEKAYRAHAGGETEVPHSTFLRIPGLPDSRVISLLGYLGGTVDLAGMKLLSSFPGNAKLGKPRASGFLTLLSAETGEAKAILGASSISVQRTAASGALAAKLLVQEEIATVALVGAGKLNFEILRFLRKVLPGIHTAIVFDHAPILVADFVHNCRHTFHELDVTPGDAKDIESALRGLGLISFATTARQPHIGYRAFVAGSTILNISLRDLFADAILRCENVVDDADHVCRARTSVHLAEIASGSRAFIRCSLGDILRGNATPRADHSKAAVFSPFGLSVLDIAVGKLVYDIAQTSVSCFLSYSHGDEEFASLLYRRLREAGIGAWCATEDMSGGDRLIEQIDRAIRTHDKVLLILSACSMKSSWVATEIRRARYVEAQHGRRKLFPIRLVDMPIVRDWTCFDSDAGTDLAAEVREYFIPDFSNWMDHGWFESAFERLLRDLRGSDGP